MRIIVSYRRSDSSATAGRIYDHMRQLFGETSVFMDVDAIPFGIDFRRHIQDALLGSDVLLAVIGPHWLGALEDGTRRIDDAADPVRVEVETALTNGIPIIPVLIDGAPMPGAGQLPDALRDLAFLNAAPVDMGRDFRAHMERLSRAVDGIVSRNRTAELPAPPPPRSASAPSRSTMTVCLALLAVVGLGLGLGAWLAASAAREPPASAAAVETRPASPGGDRQASEPAAPGIVIQNAAAAVRSKAHGGFVWHELWTTNAASAQVFYRSVMGWNGSTRGAGTAAYTTLSAGSAPVAGLATLPAASIAQGARPSWYGYVAVTDVDASAAEVRKLGGTVYLGPADIAGIGRYALVADPQGGTIVLLKPQADYPAATGVGAIGWREFLAGDRNAAFDFYTSLFGWAKAAPGDAASAGIDLLTRGEAAIGAMRAKPAGAAASWTYFLEVDGLEAAAARVRSGGGTVLDQPRQMHGGFWTVSCLDPQGAAFSLMSRAR